MTKDKGKNEKILLQVMDYFRGFMPVGEDMLVLALQLMAWAKVSHDGKLPEELRIHPFWASTYNWSEFMSRWAYFSEFLGDEGRAFLKGPSLGGVDPARLTNVIGFCTKLAETGLLDHFDPTDSIVALFPNKKIWADPLPTEFADFLVELAEITPNTTVYTPWDSYGQLAGRAKMKGATVYLEMLYESPMPALVSLFLGGGIKIAFTDPIRDPLAVESGQLRKFDVAIASVPFVNRYDPKFIETDFYGRFPEKTTSATVLSLYHLLAQAEKRIVVAVPNSLLFSTGSEYALREKLLSKGLIESVVTMPSGLFPTMSISFSVLKLRLFKTCSKIHFVNADADLFRKFVSKARTQLTDVDGLVARTNGKIIDENVVVVPTEEVLRNDAQLQVNRYQLLCDEKKIDRLLKNSEKIPLGQLVKFVRPQFVSKFEAGDQTFVAYEVGTADLPPFGYISNLRKVVKFNPDTVATLKQHFMRPQLLQPYDIVLVIKGSIGKVGIVPAEIPKHENSGWIAGQSLIILRVGNPAIIDPRVLFVFLRSQLGQAFFQRISTGASIPLIQLRELQQLPIVVPDKALAQSVIDALEAEWKIRKEIEQLQAQQAELSSQFWKVD